MGDVGIVTSRWATADLPVIPQEDYLFPILQIRGDNRTVFET